MVQIIARESRNGIDVSLSARIYRRGEINNAIGLGITLSKPDWQVIELLLKNADQAEKSGNAVSLRDNLAIRLWEIKKRLDAVMEAGAITVPEAKEIINSILHKEVLEERERLQAKAELERQQKAEEERQTLMDWIETFISQCESGERLKRKSAKQITEGTIKSYRGTQSQLKHYQEARHKVIDFDDVTIDFYDDWKRFFLEKKDKKGNPRPYSPNTIGRHVKNLKIFLYAAKEMKLTTNSDFESARFTVDSQDVENVYLTDERVQELYVADFQDKKFVESLMKMAPDTKERDVMRDQLTRRTPKILNEAKDIFVVGCLTGQRVSDYKRINSSMIRTLSDGNDYLYLQQEKTGKWIYIPLDLRVRAILERYGGSLPPIYDQDLNERIKVVGRLMNWRENAGITELHGVMEVPTNKAFYECIKTHTARRTFATNAYRNRMSLSAIMIITGHSSERMLKKYLKLDKEERAMMAAAEFTKNNVIKLKMVE